MFISNFVFSVIRWCVVNVPLYFGRGCELAGPYLLLVFEKVGGVAAYCMAVMESAALYIPVIKEKVRFSFLMHFGHALHLYIQFRERPKLYGFFGPVFFSD